jgi:hypothetical protein
MDTPSQNPDALHQKIRYRKESDIDIEDAQDRRERYREFIEDMIMNGDGNDLLDTLLMYSNICETAMYRRSISKEQWKWNTTCAYSLRQVLRVLSNLSDPSPKPNIELEDQSLYFIEQQRLH